MKKKPIYFKFKIKKVIIFLIILIEKKKHLREVKFCLNLIILFASFITAIYRFLERYFLFVFTTLF